MPRLLPLRLPRVCVAIVGVTPAEMFEKAEAVVRDNPFIELRLDYIRQPALALQKLRRFADYHPESLLIATCRRAVNGGKFRGSVAAQVDVLVKAAANGSQFVDLELESAAALKSKDLDRLRAAAAVILSFHDFRATHKLDETFEKMAVFPADYYKVVSTAKSLYDNVVMMKFLERQSEKHSLIGLSMGEQGIISRVLCVRAGSVFTFASAAAGEETAPGQIAARTLRDTYRIDQVDAATKVYGVAGDTGGALALAAHAEHRVPPRERERRVPRAARHQADGPAGLRPRHSPARAQHHHALQRGDHPAPG